MPNTLPVNKHTLETRLSLIESAYEAIAKRKITIYEFYTKLGGFLDRGVFSGRAGTLNK
jgi:hypothetical protein